MLLFGIKRTASCSAISVAPYHLILLRPESPQPDLFATCSCISQKQMIPNTGDDQITGKSMIYALIPKIGITILIHKRSAIQIKNKRTEHLYLT